MSEWCHICERPEYMCAQYGDEHVSINAPRLGGPTPLSAMVPAKATHAELDAVAAKMGPPCSMTPGAEQAARQRADMWFAGEEPWR